MIGYCNSSLIPWKCKGKVVILIFTRGITMEGKNKNIEHREVGKEYRSIFMPSLILVLSKDEKKDEL